MAMETVLLTNLTGIAAAILLLWVASLVLRDASIVDIFWGAGFVLVAWLSLWASGQSLSGALLLLMMVTLWGIRLTGYLAWRNGASRRTTAMRQCGSGTASVSQSSAWLPFSAYRDC